MKVIFTDGDSDETASENYLVRFLLLSIRLHPEGLSVALVERQGTDTVKFKI
ncbi:hypothetical protein HM1_1133 [Heliomicrobium modesticaldum Ice1]|uniref:Uncharacterized protein n=1 Tax=Heliobacterium modesticaldum (strain ATCC 51547 / Ice1) TaxID=498761 RepID=B0THK3_HELMI|nr:hypothetical protein HM1_1133 [Heliomicrobium modesticaldum Ice1]